MQAIFEHTAGQLIGGTFILWLVLLGYAVASEAIGEWWRTRHVVRKRTGVRI